MQVQVKCIFAEKHHTVYLIYVKKPEVMRLSPQKKEVFPHATHPPPLSCQGFIERSAYEKTWVFCF